MAQEYIKALDKLLLDLDEIQKFGTEILEKIENSLSTSYPNAAVAGELKSLLGLIECFSENAKKSGASSLSSNVPDLTSIGTHTGVVDGAGNNAVSNSLAILIKEKTKSVDQLNSEKEYARSNAHVALGVKGE